MKPLTMQHIAKIRQYRELTKLKPLFLPKVTFCAAKGHVLHAKRPPFAVQKAAFYNALIIKDL